MSKETKSPGQAKTKKTDKYKIVLLGDQSVGKSCIIIRYMNDTFNEDYTVFIH